MVIHLLGEDGRYLPVIISLVVFVVCVMLCVFYVLLILFDVCAYYLAYDIQIIER